MSSYHTRQRDAIEKFFLDNQERGFTPDEVASSLAYVPKSTVYRIMTQLSEEEFLRKTGTDGRKSIFQYQGDSCASHMHIRCRMCGRTEHLSCEATERIESLVEETSGFVALDSTVFEGLCSECRRKYE